MARIFITGSSDGLGSKAARRLIKNGHTVVLHARNAQRAKDAMTACPGAETVLIGDLSSIKETKKLAEDANKLGAFDTVIHNAGLYRGGFEKTDEGYPALIAVNTFAPYILTCLMARPKRLVYLSSGLHSGGDPSIKDIAWQERGERAWNDGQGYANSKMHNIMFAKAIARRWKDVEANSMDPGWVATKMGGSGAPGDLDASLQTYVLLAEGPKCTGKYYKPGGREAAPTRSCDDEEAQNRLLTTCEEITQVKLPQ